MGCVSGGGGARVFQCLIHLKPANIRWSHSIHVYFLRALQSVFWKSWYVYSDSSEVISCTLLGLLERVISSAEHVKTCFDHYMDICLVPMRTFCLKRKKLVFKCFSVFGTEVNVRLRCSTAFQLEQWKVLTRTVSERCVCVRLAFSTDHSNSLMDNEWHTHFALMVLIYVHLFWL